MKKVVLTLAYAVFALGAAGAAAEVAVVNPVARNVIQLSASGTVDVEQDLLQLTLTTTKDGADAAAVQSALKGVLDNALLQAQKTAQAGQLDVRTGNFGLYPRYGKEGRVSAWEGSTELILEGRDFSRITAAAARIQGLTLGQVSFGLSREERGRVEADAQAQAIERFKARAAELSRRFGFAGYTLREISVDVSDSSPGQRPRLMAMDAKAASSSSAPVPVQAGKSTVMVTVSGTVQMQ